MAPVLSARSRKLAEASVGMRFSCLIYVGLALLGGKFRRASIVGNNQLTGLVIGLAELKEANLLVNFDPEFLSAFLLCEHLILRNCYITVLGTCSWGKGGNSHHGCVVSSLFDHYVR
jgi:hypothetical protein